MREEQLPVVGGEEVVHAHLDPLPEAPEPEAEDAAVLILLTPLLLFSVGYDLNKTRKT